VTEGSGSAVATFAVTLSSASSDTVSVRYATANGTATRADYVRKALTTLVFEPGETSMPVTVNIKSDKLDENEETFQVMLSGATKATIADVKGVGTIVDDDPPPALSIESKSFAEGSDVHFVFFRVTLSAPSGLLVKVDYATGPGTATPGTEYRPKSGTLTFQPGRTTKTIVIWTKGELVDEPDETFFVNLQRAVNATITVGQATATIRDDDPRAVSQ
jgi:hypothetical protein